MDNPFKLGRLSHVELRDAWPHEASDFTKWLAKEENLELLSDEIGINLKLVEIEASVGSFNVDILAEEEGSDHKVIIENQLERTNHDHLGKLITYASGLDAKTIIWICKEIREEHRQAVDWLNEHTGEEISFFVVRMELWKIGDCDPAPKFQIICNPNEWAKTVKHTSEQGELKGAKLFKLNFWTEFNEYLQEHGSVLSPRKALPQHWYSLALGSSICNITLTVINSNQITCNVTIPDDKDFFHFLFERRASIEKDLGMTLEWEESENVKRTSIWVERQMSDLHNKTEREEALKWLVEKAEKFKKVFPKYIEMYSS